MASRGWSRFGHALRLGPELVQSIHHQGGTLLGSSRGGQDPREMVDTIEALGLGALFVVGGDGTLKAATKIVAELERRSLPVSVIGIPKTIDNDLHFIDRSFGFERVLGGGRSCPQRARRGQRRAQRHRSGQAHGRHSASSPVTRRWRPTPASC